MGIYIPNMEMPKNCFSCRYICGLRDTQKFTKNCRPDCPLVPVPPHGRLGDLDALRKEIDRLCDQYDAGIIEALTCLNGILMAISNAPTIILADPATGEVVENE